MLNTKDNQKQFHELKCVISHKSNLNLKKWFLLTSKHQNNFDANELIWAVNDVIGTLWTSFWHLLNVLVPKYIRRRSKMFLTNMIWMSVQNLSSLVQATSAPSFVFIAFFGICKKQPFWKCIFDIGPIKVTYLYDFSSFGKLDV